VPTVTRLEPRGGRVAVELDGTPWRVLPADVVVRAGLVSGRALDRPALREVRRELRRAEALGVAVRALRTRDLSRAAVAARLERAAVPRETAATSLATLERAGVIDDGRVARSRALALAARGYGDAAIRHRLEQEGLAAQAADALAELEPEATRAEAIVARRGRGARTARYLAGRGFAEEALEAALGASFGQE
jgi:SOS response regulatory protein OraA/RecX